MISSISALEPLEAIGPLGEVAAATVRAESRKFPFGTSPYPKRPVLAINLSTLRNYEIVTLGVFLCLCQLADGLFTALGVDRYGPAMEGNGLLRLAMYEIGHYNALLLFKAIAIILVFALCKLSPRVSWIRPALRVLAVVYLFGAIIPWSYILIPNFA